MSPSHSRRGAARYRYYVSSALIQGRPEAARSISRVPAVKIEAAIVEAVRRRIGLDWPGDDTELITICVLRIEVRRTEIAVCLASTDRDPEEETVDAPVFTVPWSRTMRASSTRLQPNKLHLANEGNNSITRNNSDNHKLS